MTSPVIDTALSAHRAGLCVLPPKEDGSKAPDVSLSDGGWTHLQVDRLTEDEIRAAYRNGRTGLGFVCGCVSGGLELLDFDERSAYDDFRAMACEAGLGDLMERLEAGYLEHTPNGAHYLYYCTETECTKLAQRPKEDGGFKTLIETKGEGGYAIVAPSNGSVHPSGKPYVLVSGSVETIPTISQDEREELHRVARTFDSCRDREPRADGGKRGTPSSSSGELRPGDDFNARVGWDEVLEGWIRVFERGGVTHWRRPGKDIGISATTNHGGTDRFACFSSSTPFESVLDTGKATYDKFGAYALLHHDSNIEAATKDLAAKGYGSPNRKRTRQEAGSTGSTEQEPEPWESPIRFDDFNPATFPVDALPDWVREWVEAESVAAQVPADLAAIIALGVCSTAVASKASVRVKEGYTEPLNLYFVVALPPANRKTQVFGDATRPLVEYETELSEAMRSHVARELAQIEVLRDRLKKARKSAVDAKPENRGKELADAEDLAEQLAQAEHDAPAYPRLVADDVTPEALGFLLQQQNGRIGLLSAEGGELFEIISGRYTQNSKPNLSVFLNGHSGDPIRVDRMKREPVFVKDPALTICITVQPEVIRGLTSDRALRGRGLLGRFLYSIPRSPLGERDSRAKSVPAEVAAEYAANVERLLRLPIANREVELDAEAARLWFDFADKLEPKLAEHGELGHMGDWAGKLPGAVARLAGVLHAAENSEEPDPWATRITALSLQRAIQLADYFTDHAHIAFGLMGIDDDVERAMRIWHWIRDTGLAEVQRQDLWQQFKNGTVKKADELDKLTALLIEHRYLRLRPVPGDQQGTPGRKARIYDVNPEAMS